jgi:hypothetical protein
MLPYHASPCHGDDDAVSVNHSGVMAKMYAMKWEQDDPIKAKHHRITSFRIVKWTIVVGGIETGIQFAALLFMPIR